MINPSEALTTYLKSTGRSFKAKIKLGDNIITDNINEITLFSPLMSDKMSFGSVVSSYVEVSLFNCPANIGGCEAEISLTTDAIENEEISLGFFTVEKPKTIDYLTTFTAYDRVKSKIKGTYDTALSGETDIDEIFAELCTQCGVGYEPLYPDNTANSEKAKIDVSLLDGKEKLVVFEQIAAFFGGNLICNRNGKFEIRTLSECTAEYDADMTDTPEIGDKTFVLHKLTCTANGKTLTKGEGAGVDFSCDIMTEKQFEKLFEALDGFSYTSVSCDILVGDPRIEVGDIVTVKQGENAYKIPVMQLELTFDGGITTKIDSFVQTEQEAQSERSVSLSDKIRKSTKYAEAAQRAHDEFIETLRDGLDKGLHQTVKTSADGSNVTYYHDKPQIENSTYIQVFTSSGRAWTQGTDCWNNGDPAWQYGETKDGDAILRDLLVRTLTADLIRAGKLSSFDGATCFDLDNAELVTSSGGQTTAVSSGNIVFTRTKDGGEDEEATELLNAVLGGSGFYMNTVEPEEYTFAEPENQSEMSDLKKALYKIAHKIAYLFSSAYGVNIVTEMKNGKKSYAHLDGGKLKMHDMSSEKDSEYRPDGAEIDGDVNVKGNINARGDVTFFYDGEKLGMGEALDAISKLVVPQSFTVEYESGEEATKAQYVSCGERVDIFYRGSYKVHAAGDLLFTLPSEFSPTSNVYTPITLATSVEGVTNIAGAAKIATDGKVTIQSADAAEYKTRIYLQATYYLM